MHVIAQMPTHGLTHVACQCMHLCMHTRAVLPHSNAITYGPCRSELPVHAIALYCCPTSPQRMQWQSQTLETASFGMGARWGLGWLALAGPRPCLHWCKDFAGSSVVVCRMCVSVVAEAGHEKRNARREPLGSKARRHQTLELSAAFNLSQCLQASLFFTNIIIIYKSPSPSSSSHFTFWRLWEGSLNKGYKCKESSILSIASHQENETIFLLCSLFLSSFTSSHFRLFRRNQLCVIGCLWFSIFIASPIFLSS